MFCCILNADKSLEANLKTNMAGHVREDCFGVKLSLILGIMNSTDRREEKRNFLIQGKCFRRSFKHCCNYRYFMKLSRLLSIVSNGNRTEWSTIQGVIGQVISNRLST